MTSYENRLKLQKALTEIIIEQGWSGKVFYVGGCVRDSIIGRDVKDFDLIVDVDDGASEMVHLLQKKLGGTVYDFPRFGTACLKAGGLEIECVIPRKEIYDGFTRNPQVTRGTIEDDLKRRDFTINAIAEDVLSGERIDPFDGEADIGRKLLRCPDSPLITFREDPLRILRMYRFAAQLGFMWDYECMKGVTSNADLLTYTSKERVRDELNKIMLCEDPDKHILSLLRANILRYISPLLDVALRRSEGMAQNEYHQYDVLRHILVVLRASEPTLANRWAALLHDIGKPFCRTPHPKKIGQFQFIGHEFVSSDIAKRILAELKFPAVFIDEVCTAVKCHMSMKNPKDASDKAIRKWVRKTGDHMDTCIKLLKADAYGHKHEEDDPGDTVYLDNRIAELGADKPESIKQRVIKGQDVIDYFSLTPGPVVGEIMKKLQDLFDDNPALTKDEALEAVRPFFFKQA